MSSQLQPQPVSQIGLELGGNDPLIILDDLSDSDLDKAAELAVAGATLTVAKKGNGSGSIASSPAGVSCGATCSASAVWWMMLAARDGGSWPAFSMSDVSDDPSMNSIAR